MLGVKSLAQKGSRDFHSASVNPQSFFAIAPFAGAIAATKNCRPDRHQDRFSCASALAMVSRTGVFTTILGEFAFTAGTSKMTRYSLLQLLTLTKNARQRYLSTMRLIRMGLIGP